MLRAELMPCCQGKCQEMFAWGDCRVPVAKQGELFSPPLWHIKPNWHSWHRAGLRTAFQTCQICQHCGGFIKKNNINIPGDQIRLPANDLSPLFFHDWDVHPGVSFFFFFFFHDVSLRIVAQMTKQHDMKNKVKPNTVKTKRLMCLRTLEWHCQPRLKRRLLTEHPKWKADTNPLTWKARRAEAESGMNSQYVSLCLPRSWECVEAISLRLRSALARGL